MFHDFNRTLVQTVFEAGVSRNVYCVNIEGVIAALLLEMLWQPYPQRRVLRRSTGDGGIHDLPAPAYAGLRCGDAEHMNRGRTMDTRTPAWQRRFVA